MLTPGQTRRGVDLCLGNRHSENRIAPGRDQKSPPAEPGAASALRSLELRRSVMSPFHVVQCIPDEVVEVLAPATVPAEGGMGS